MTRTGLLLVPVLGWLAATSASAEDRTAPTAVLDTLNQVAIGATLQLSGARSSDIGGRVLRYVWTRIQGSGGDMTLNLPFGTLVSSYVVAQTAANPLAPGRHRFQLYVEDDSGNRSATVEREVVVADTAVPTAVLDVPKTIPFGSALQLSGARSSDVGGRVVSYVWSRLEGSGGGMVLNQPVKTDADSYNVPQAAGNLLAAGRHGFRLSVMDDSGNVSQTADRQVIVVDNIAPTAVLSAPKSVTQIEPFQLTGTRSFDIGGRVVRFQWTRIDGGNEGPMPIGQPFVTDTSAFSVAQSLTNYLAVGRHHFRLVVMDDAGNQSQVADFPVEIIAPLPAGRSQ